MKSDVWRWMIAWKILYSVHSCTSQLFLRRKEKGTVNVSFFLQASFTVLTRLLNGWQSPLYIYNHVLILRFLSKSNYKLKLHQWKRYCIYSKHKHSRLWLCRRLKRNSRLEPVVVEPTGDLKWYVDGHCISPLPILQLQFKIWLTVLEGIVHVISCIRSCTGYTYVPSW